MEKLIGIRLDVVNGTAKFEELELPVEKVTAKMVITKGVQRWYGTNHNQKDVNRIKVKSDSFCPSGYIKLEAVAEPTHVEKVRKEMLKRARAKCREDYRKAADALESLSTLTAASPNSAGKEGGNEDGQIC
jgi:alpha-galactosidase